MITFKFDLESQDQQYEIIKNRLKTGFWQSHQFYILPIMPEKFRNRVVYFPKTCEPEKVYHRHKNQLDKLESDWHKTQDKFITKIEQIFPQINELDIEISPALFGTLGSYQLYENKIIIKPRYDRDLRELQNTIITALTHYYHFGFKDMLNYKPSLWRQKQALASKFQLQINGKDSKSFLNVLDKEFAGKLAETSAKYLTELGYPSKQILEKPTNLTDSESKIYDLLLKNINKLVTFEQLGDAIWPDNLDKYSEYAITKLVARLKKKLPPRIIHSQRGTGYLLYQS